MIKQKDIFQWIIDSNPNMTTQEALMKFSALTKGARHDPKFKRLPKRDYFTGTHKINLASYSIN